MQELEATSSSSRSSVVSSECSSSTPLVCRLVINDLSPGCESFEKRFQFLDIARAHSTSKLLDDGVVAEFKARMRAKTCGHEGMNNDNEKRR